MSTKKIILGVLLSDGSIDKASKRFFFFSKHEEYANYVASILRTITRVNVTVKLAYRNGKSPGYRLWTNKNVYFDKLHEKLYPNGVASLTPWAIARIDAEALAHIWMGDGFLEHAKNKRTNKVQNVGFLCFEAYPKAELELLQQHLLETFTITSSLKPVRWGHGFRIRFGGENLQKLISLVYPFILEPFKHKTILFYRGKEYVYDLPNMEHIIQHYDDVEDIVRHPLKGGQTENGTTSTPGWCLPAGVIQSNEIHL